MKQRLKMQGVSLQMRPAPLVRGAAYREKKRAFALAINWHTGRGVLSPLYVGEKPGEAAEEALKSRLDEVGEQHGLGAEVDVVIVMSAEAKAADAVEEAN